MPILTVLNNKGGVAKTTTAINIASGLAAEGNRVLLIDLDSQANLTISTIGQENDAHVGHWLSGEKPLSEVVQPYVPNLSIIPSSKALDIYSKFIGSEEDYQFKLKDRIDSDRLTEQYDYILIDNAPSLTTLAYCSLVAATHVLIPSAPEYFSFAGIDNIMQSVANVKKRYNRHLQVLGIFFTKYHSSYRKKVANDVVEAARDTFGDLVLSSTIRVNASLEEAQMMRQPVYNYAPDSNGATDYANLLEEIKTRL
ncbi:ParA family protein [Pontibacter rugosus]|uniref:ParA family protein n=1 Tax=Pontibacter rugosus TaxID=1745966 RepID=A0ABW3SRY3_9BACT